MGKTLSVTWLGDEDPYRQMIVEAGIEFVKGRPIAVPADHEFGGRKWMPKFQGNRMFSVDHDEQVINADDEAEIAATKALLDEKGVTYRTNASLDTLRKKLDEAA